MELEMFVKDRPARLYSTLLYTVFMDNEWSHCYGKLTKTCLEYFHFLRMNLVAKYTAKSSPTSVFHHYPTRSTTLM